MKILKRRKKPQNSPELQKPNIEAEIYNSNEKCDWEKNRKKKKKAQKLSYIS